MAARAKAKKEADDKFMTDAMATAKQMMAADEVRRAAQAANLSDAPLHALADAKTPVPLPEGAEDVEFNAERGKLEFNSSSSVKMIAEFYRGSLKSQGWKEQPSVINKSSMVVMEFSRGWKKAVVHRDADGPKVNVSADGSGLVMANARPDAKPDAVSSQASNASGGKVSGGGSRSRSRFRFAGAEAAQHELAWDRETPGTEIPFRTGTRSQRSCRIEFSARFLSQRTHQTRMEGIHRSAPSSSPTRSSLRLPRPTGRRC